jgi:hypothetical protein
MTLLEIITEIRSLADDEVGLDDDLFWSSSDLLAYVNRVYRKIAKECLCIRDASTPAVCQIAVDPVDYTTLTSGTLDHLWANSASSPLYQLDVTPYLLALHASVLQIDEVKWAVRPWTLTKVSSQKWAQDVMWEQRVADPTEYATDLNTGKLALNYRSTAADILLLRIRRLPLADLAADTDVPEFRSAYHDAFMDGVLELMYLKQDAESFDKKKAEIHGKRFLDRLDEIKHLEEELDKKLTTNAPMRAFL